MRNLHLTYVLTILLISSCLSLSSQSSLWGVTTAGGNGAGSIFGLSTGGNSFSSQYNMTDNSGGAPAANRMLEVSGKLYGMTPSGGANNLGVLFVYDPVSNMYTPLASFTGTTGAVMGANPNGGLIAISSKLYGLTKAGGTNNMGTIFSYDIPSNTYSVLASFSGGTGTVSGSQPLGTLYQALDGNLYGYTSHSNGGSGNGGLFQFITSSGSYSLLCSFTGTAGTFPGNSPQGGSLMEASNGKLQGTTVLGGTANSGVLFEYNYSTSTYSVLANFTSTMGTLPIGSVIKSSSNGKYYGTTFSGTGTSSLGVVFEFDPATAGYVKTDVSASGASKPWCTLLEASNGKLYGTTQAGGTAGTLFEYDVTSNTLAIKVSFTTTSGGQPESSLIQYSGNGKLYGLTLTGGSNGAGVIFEYDITNNIYTKKVDLNNSTGGQPNGGLVFYPVTGRLYGMATTGGTTASNGGVIYEYDYTSNTYVKRVDLNATNGRFPYGALTQATNNVMYGLMSSGGTSSVGTLIQYTPGTSSYAALVNFNGTNGSTPYGSLIQASNGNLYGMTSAGGASSAGVLFEYNIGTNTYTDKFDFGGSNGATPYGSVIQATNGSLYGLTSAGGTNSVGVLFEYNVGTGTYTKKVDLSSSGGANPYGSLVQANNGKLYGMTSNGGANGLGVIFEYDITSNTYTKKIDLSTTNGSQPYGSLVKAANGKLYGLTTAGGTNSVGVLFEYDPSNNSFTKDMDLSSTTGSSPGYTQLTEICNLPNAAGAISATSAICFSDATAQSFSISPISNATSYTWTIPSGASITSGSDTGTPNVNLSGLAAGVYTVGVAGVNVCGTGTLSSKTISVYALPVISISNQTICSGTSATLLPGGASTYTIEGGNAIVSPTITSTYTITGTDANGCISGSAAMVTVAVNSSPNISVSNGSICVGDSYSLSPTGASSYSVNGVSGGLQVSPSTTTTYSITGTGANGCTSTGTALATVTVNAIPSISASSGSICSGGVFSISPSGTDSYSVTGGNFTVSPTLTTTYSVTGTSSAGCAASNTAAVTVSVIASPTLAVNSGSICSSNSFTIIPSGADTYSITGNSFTVSPGLTTSYTVTGTSSVGCAASNNGIVSTVTVFNTPTISVPGGSVCAGATFTSPISTGGAGVSSYTVTGGTYTLSGSNLLFNPTTTTTFSVIGSSSVGCVSSQTTIAVTVNTVPVVSANSGSICSGNSYTIIPNGASTYSIAGNTFTVAPNASAIYTVAGTSPQGCISSVINASVTVYATPTVVATSGSICAGGSYTIPLGGASTYTFTNAGSPTVTPAATTSYSVIGSSTAGCVSSNVVVTVTVNTNPTITVNSGTICPGSSFTISPGGADTYTVAGGTLTVSPTTASTYTVVGSTTAGCVSGVVTSSVDIDVSPTISINTASAICVGETATLIANGGNSYTWAPGVNGATITASPGATADYSVIGADALGCTSTASVTLVVNPLPNIVVASGAVCPGNSFTFTPSGAVTYTYSSGSNVVTPSSTTSYSITGTDANGCTSTLAVVATVTVSNTLPVSISGQSSVCIGSSLTLTAGGASTYSWSTGDATINVAVTPTNNTTYTVTGYSGSCSNTATFAVNVIALPSIQVSTSSSTLCTGESAILTASGALTYTWMSVANGVSSISVTPTQVTTYTVIGADANCSNVTTFTQYVDACLGLTSIPKEISFNVYPNPNSGEFSIESPKAITITVVNTLGEVVVTQLLQEGKNTVNIGVQAKGLYFIQAANDKQFKSTRIAVQ